MELIFELTHNLFKVASIFSLISDSRAYILGLGNLTKERDTLKGKCETMELR